MTHATANLSTISNTQTLTMSSREIAELTGKRHDNIVRDIRNMLAELGDASDLRDVVETKDARGYTDRFNLPKDLTITLVSGYNVQMRYAITKRWMELEAQVSAAPALPTSFAEALRMAADLEEQKETLRLQNEAMRPAAKVGMAVGKLSRQTITEFVSQLPGVNTRQVQRYLSELGYLRRDARGRWRVRSKYRDKEFAMATHAANEAFSCVVVLQKGREKLVELYQAGCLPMKKGSIPDTSMAL
jgi:phage regulator Rha-like protein